MTIPSCQIEATPFTFLALKVLVTYSYKEKNIQSASRDWAEREDKKYLSCLSKDLTTWNWLPMPLLIWRQESEMTPIDVQNSSLIETKINSWQELEKKLLWRQ